MPKKYILITFLILGIHFLNAQETFTPEKRNQVGIGASEFINSVFSSDGNSFSLEYRRYFNNYN